MTKIEWADVTWNPIRALDKTTGQLGHWCAHVSEGCRNCYAERLQARFGQRVPFKAQARERVEIRLDDKVLAAPLRWRKPRRVFVCSMTDLFGAWVSDAWLDRIFAIMALSPHHQFQILTKRPERMRVYLTETSRSRWMNAANGFGRAPALIGRATYPFPNVWLGVSAEDQATAEARIPPLLETPAALRFLSAEPLLGPMDLRPVKFGHMMALSRLDWVIVGGESGPGARPMHPGWARGLRDQCVRAGVPFFFKQHGEWIGEPDLRHLPDGGGPGFGAYDHCPHDLEHEAIRVGKARAGRLLDGREWSEWPA